ncbi:hypothetical protein [Bosea sp. (in: a-proteobacteria)]
MILVTDALCSSADATHEALMELCRNRFSEQIEATNTAGMLTNWR